MKILVADDNSFYRSMLEATLAHWGYEVVAAADGEEAWQRLQEKDAPRLAILDWMMPRLDGLELCRRLRAQARAQPTYLILLTARGGKENLVTGLINGADDYISKPFDCAELHARLQTGVRIIELQANLAARVQELEHALSAAQKLEIMGRLAGGVAHDFNNLLTVILGGCDLVLLGTQGNPTNRAMVEMVKKAGDRGAALTRQLLAFSRGQNLMPAVLDVNALINSGVSLWRRLIPEDIAIQTSLDAAVGRIRADAGQIDQVLMNLILNARDAMAEGGIISIETSNVEIADTRPGVPGPVPAGAYVLCAVKDTGHGIPPAILPHIFEPFFTTKESGKGTGLGLATVYGVVMQSGGHIQVDSRENAGTTVNIYLPEVADCPVLVPAGPRRAVQPSGKQTILLVEDEDHVRGIARHILAADSFKVLEARDGEEALRVSQQWSDPIHLLLTDVVMPRLNGRQLADRMQPLRPAMRVLFMSGYAQEEIMQHAVHPAPLAFLEKPFTPERLLGKVRQTLEN